MAIINGDGDDNGLDGTSGTDTISGFGGNDICYGREGDDTIYGGEGLDTLVGHNGFDELYGGAGDDALQGGGGDSTVLTTSHASELIDGGGGRDLLVVEYEGFVIVGSGAPARVTIDISTGAGEAVVSGFRGENFIAIEAIEFAGPEGNDRVTGGNFQDRIFGNGGNDVLRGLGGNDLIVDSWGFIDADGGAGTDTFSLNRSANGHADGPDDVIDGNAGTITVGGVAMGTFVNFEILDLAGGKGDDTVSGRDNSVNRLGGGQGDDTIIGRNLADTLYGGTGNDTVTGSAGSDTAYGGKGNDIIHGDTGDDLLYAEGGHDEIHGDSGDDVVDIDLSTSTSGSAFFGESGTDSLRIDRGALLNIDLTGTTIHGFEALDDFNGVFFLAPYVITMTTAQFKQFDEIHLNSFSDDTTIKFADNATVVLPATSGFRTVQLANGGQKVDLSACVVRPFLVTGGTGDDTVIPFSNPANFYDANLGNGEDTYEGLLSLDRVSGGNGDDELNGGAGNDQLHGDAGTDMLNGEDGDDILTGGADVDHMDGGIGLDKFAYALVSDSTGANFDLVHNFDANAQDRFDLTFAVSGVDTKVTTGDLSGASFNTDLKAAIGVNKLAAGHAVLFTPDGGQFAGKTFLIIDANAQAGYQSNADLVIQLVHGQHLTSLDTLDFI